MNLLQYKIKDDHDLNSFIEDLPEDKIILNDYFYFTNDSFSTKVSIYSDKQVARILSLTDKEYYDLIKLYFSGNEVPQDDSKLELKNRIDKINQKIQKSKDFEDSKKKLDELSRNLEKIEKDLHSYDGLEEKIAAAHNQVNEFSALQKFNLQKIHDDLVNINSQIDRLEEDLITKKIVEIKDSKIEYEFDSGKVGLGIGVTVGIGIFGAIFWLINTPFWIPLTVWIVALIAGLGIAVFSRVPKESLSENYDNELSTPEDISKALSTLKTQRDGILQLIGVRSSNEFFLMKAKYSSAKKNLDYMQSLRGELSQKLDLETSKLEREKIKSEIENLKMNTSDESVLLKSDEYLSLYRELDSLKLQLGSNSSTVGLKKEDIPSRLSEIRKELSDKLPTYTSVLKNTFERSYDKILQKLQEYFSINSSVTFTPEKNLSNWDSLNNFQKFLLELAMAEEVYVQNFMFILEEVSTWQQFEFDALRSFIDNGTNLNFDLVIIDYDRVF